jgi:hypothetical protein
VTVRVVEATIVPEVACIVVLPALPTAEAKPVLLTVATDKSEDDHDTPFVMSVTVPSLNKPVAENCCDA